MTSAPIILVPGFWLGAWAWEDVAASLRADGHDVTAVTLPGLEAPDADRSLITMSDHVDAICAAVTAAAAPVVLAVHSGAGAPGYAASGRVPGQIATMVYVDTGPATGPINPDFEADEWPLPSWEDLGENLDGISEEQLATFRRRAVPEPGGPIREAADLGSEARLDVPSTVICTSVTQEELKTYINEGYAWIGGLAELRNVTYVDLPTSHWPMWSRPAELTAIVGDVARQAPGQRR
jgi:pimeloyl-ACP methyl ester carboxylesterase